MDFFDATPSFHATTQLKTPKRLYEDNPLLPLRENFPAARQRISWMRCARLVVENGDGKATVLENDQNVGSIKPKPASLRR